MSLIRPQYLLTLDEIYNSIEQQWNNCDNDNYRKKMSKKYLSWCKNQRDLFFDDEEYESITDEKIIDNIHEYEDKWIQRVTIWSKRFTQTHKN